MRLAAEQMPLFTPEEYRLQFERVRNISYHGTWVDDDFGPQAFLRVQQDWDLCGQGFQGKDWYGAGARACLYLQWTASLLANNFLPATSNELQNVWLLFSLGICIMTVALAFIKACVFAIEIEILYWMYWGGFVCAFASSPCQVKLGSKVKWVGLHWSTVILYLTHMLMTYHAIWFVWYAYDHVFSRSPCGTYHYFILPMRDPSERFWALKDFLMWLMSPLAYPLLLLFRLLAVLLAAEIKQSVKTAATYQMFFPRTTHASNSQQQPADSESSKQLSLRLRVYSWLSCFYSGLRFFYYVLRDMFGLPSRSRAGIRLITPIDIKHRRTYRFRCAAFGLTSWVLAVSAIETTLKWNKVRQVHSVASSDQYMPLIAGIGGLVVVSWRLLQQEGRRRRDIRSQWKANEDLEGTEMVAVSTNLANAIAHAFQQPDQGFLTNDGALPTTRDDVEEDQVLSDPARRSNDDDSLRQSDEYVMSGALAV
ncbi:hypothetical protein H2200_010985 [Cladophialophora chaetospira]|uniref:Uncharacterized protein n=1 Tax=Cladophialophora chaetospira TaxID=386627 RepID=A0AA38X179_9EURO|nr:hypothetical protein H2200_010985 [Cladophialophora chaetospira]